MKEIVNLSINGMQYAVRKEEWERVPPQNFKTIVEYDQTVKDENLTNITRENTIQFLLMFSKVMQKSFRDMTAKDLKNFLDDCKAGNATKANYIIRMRKFFRWLYEDENPECIKLLKNGKIKEQHKKWSEMLTEENIQNIIDTFTNIQHKALVSVLYDSACRVGELVGLKRKDVVCSNGLWTISVDGKTGVRNIPLTFSTVHFMPWFNESHPFKDDPEAPVFFSMSHKDLYKEAQDRSLCITSVWYLLQQGARSANINKKIHPHLLRHSRLTWLSDHGMSENMMRIYAGWTNGSNMPAVYLHTNPANIALKIRQIQGTASPEEMKPEPSKLLPKKCPRCNAENDPSSPYCKQCWLPLDIKVGLAETIMVDLVRSTWYDVVSRAHVKEGEYVPIEEMAESFQVFKQNTQLALDSGKLPDGVRKVAQRLMEPK